MLDLYNLVRKKAPCRGPKFDVLLYIADRADKKGFAYPSIEYISAKTRWCARTVQSAIHWLEGQPYFTVTQSRGGRGLRNGYTIDRETLQAMPDFDRVPTRKTVHAIASKRCTRQQINHAPDAEESSSDTSIETALGQNPTKRISAPERVDGVPTQRSLQEVLESFEQIGGKVDIRNGKPCIVGFPPGDHKNLRAYISLKDATKGNGGSELMALLRNRGIKPATEEVDF